MLWPLRLNSLAVITYLQCDNNKIRVFLLLLSKRIKVSPVLFVSKEMSENDVSRRDCELVQLNGEKNYQGNEEDDEVRERSRLLKIRKKQELKLVKRFDKSAINVAKECWFLIDSDWLNKWSAFVNGGDEEDSPGALSTRGILRD